MTALHYYFYRIDCELAVVSIVLYFLEQGRNIWRSSRASQKRSARFGSEESARATAFFLTEKEPNRLSLTENNEY